MKKIIYSLFVMALAFFAASCQQENLEQFANGNTVTYTVQVPDVITTRATSDDRVDHLIYQVYREAEIADLTNNPIYTGTADINESGTAELVMEFVRNQKFIVLFWAQKEDVTAYTTTDLRQVSLSQPLTANDFTTEVFSGIDTVNDCVSANKGNVKLNRPIAQLNIATSEDGLDLGGTTTVTLNESEVTVKGLYTTYNVFNQAVSGEADFTYAKANVPAAEFKTDYPYVAMAYVGFADKAGTNVDVNFNIYTSEGEIKHTVNNVPVKANYRTNILGNLITGTAGYAVSIDNVWGGNDNNIEAVTVSNAADLQEAIDNIQDGSTGNIQLEGNIDLGTLAGMISTRTETPSYGLLIPAGKTLILDLNGCTLSQEVEQTAAYSMIQNNGHLTIIDSKGTGNTGKISYTDKGNGGEYVSNTIVNNATMIIESGVIENNSSVNVAANGYPHPVDNNGNLTINGGTLSNNANYASMRIWCTTDENTSVTINGGTFEGSIDFQTPSAAANKGVLTINGGTFVADTYTNSAVRLLGFGADVDEMFGYIKGGNFTGEIAIRNWSGQEMNSQVFYISGGTFNTDVNNFTAETSVAIKDGEVWVIRDAYARIGNTKYTSLEAALEAALDNETVTVTVLADTEIGAPFTLANGKTLTLDLNAKTVSGSSSNTSKNYDMIDVRGTLTVKNGTITAEFTGENMGWNHSTNVFNVTAGGVLNLNGVTAKNLGGSDMGFVAHLNNWGEVTLNVENSTLESNYVAVRVFNSGYDMNNVTIKNSTLKGGSYAFWVHNYTTADFGGDAEKAAQQQALLNLDIFDNGNTFIGKNDTPIRYGMTDAVYTAVPAAAKIGDKEYTSLQEAIDAVKDGETIVLMRDVKQVDGALIENKNLTIDLNHKTYTVTEGANVNNRNFKVTGTSVVTIKNGTMVAEGQLTSGAYGTVRTEGEAVVTLDNVKLYSYRGYGLNVKANPGTTININNSEIYSQYSGGVEAAGGTIELTNVKIEQKGVYSGAAWCSVAIGVNGGGKVTINSGDYYAAAIASDNNAAQGTWVAYVMSSGGTLDIKGGIFNGVVAENASASNACGIICADRAAVVNIYDGTFNSNGAILDMRNNVGTQPNPVATLYGGNYSSDPRVSGLYSSNLIKVVEGKTAVQGTDGRWTLIDAVTTEDALKAAFEQGGDIVLGADITVFETLILAEGKTVVLDLNGKKLSAADMNVVKNNGGNLTIKNGTVTRTGDAVGYSVNNASGEITVENATIKRGLYTSGSKMTATNANISHEQSSRHAIYAWNCEVTINSGTFHNDNAGNATLMASGSSIVTINGGTFSIADGRSSLGWTSSMVDQNSTAQVTVKDGLFNGGFRINSADTRLTIEGGEFNTNNGSAFTDYSGTKVVKGGKFTDAGAQNWAKKYIAEGYEMNANGEVVAK